MENVCNAIAGRVSIIIPAYNAENYLRKSIDSALAQTYRNIEIIVVNDGSTDNTNHIRNEYAKKTVWLNKRNGGQASARNLGLHHASGEYIAFLDADDEYYKEKISTQIQLLNTTGCSFGICNYEIVTSIGVRKSISNIEHTRDWLLKFLEGNFICTSTVILKSALINAVGHFDESLKGTEDGDLWFRCLMHANSIAFEESVLVKYRTHDNNFSSNFRKMLCNRNLACIKQVNAIFSTPNCKLRKCDLSKCYEKQLAFRAAKVALARMYNPKPLSKIWVRGAYYSFLGSKTGEIILCIARFVKQRLQS